MRSWEFTQPEVIQELVAANENRKIIYGFLARTYATEATVEYLRELSGKKDLFLASAQDPEVSGTELAEGFKQIADYVSNLKMDDLEKARLELAVEYAGLFLGVWRVPAHPSESAYFSEGQLIMQEPRDEVLKLYRSMGVDKAGQFKEPEDHIALELQFMTHLCEKTNAALSDGDFPEARKCLRVQMDFLDEHLGKWVPKLSADILKSARREFYKAIAKITEGYVQMDKKLVVELMDSLAPDSKSHSEQ
jgi:TorA maturation chaperone TorD